VIYKIKLTAGDFLDVKCKSVFKTMQSLIDRGLEIDEVKIRAENKNVDLVWLSQLRERTPSAANFEYYEKRIKEKSAKVKLKKLSYLINDSLEGGKSSAETRELIEAELTDLATSSDGWDIKHINSIMFDAVNIIEERYKLQGKLPGIPTGFTGLDNTILGFRPRMLYLFGARPSRGKTALMLNMAMAAAKFSRVGLISTESANEELGMRIISAEAGLNSQRIASGKIKQSDFGRITTLCGQLGEQGIYFYDEPNASLPVVVAKCREMVRKEKVECIFIDYVQNIYYNEKNTERENLGAITGKLKEIARALKIPIIAMAQLRREADGMYKRPHMSDLLGSGKLEQDADVIGLIHWVVKNDAEVKRGEDPEFKYYLLIDKNRDGMVNSIELDFKKEIVKFVEVY
jgi:replicative DNA helicase